MAQPLKAICLSAVLVNKAHFVAAKCPFVRKSAGTRNMATTLNTTRRRLCSLMGTKSRWDSASASLGIKLIVIPLLLPGGLSGLSQETLLPHGTHGTGTQLAHAERQGCSLLFSGYSGAVSQGPHGGSIRVLFAL